MPLRSAVMRRSYACGTPIASTKTPRVGEGRTVASARGNDECAGYCPTMGAWSPVPVGRGPSCKKAGVHDHPLTARTATFGHPFRIRGIERLLPAGAYEVITDEETIDGLTFAAYRRIATMIMVRAEGVRNSVEMLSTGSVDLANAQAADASAAHD